MAFVYNIQVVKNRLLNGKSISYSPSVIYLSPVVISLMIITTLMDPFNSPKLWILCLLASWLLGYIITHAKRLFNPIIKKLIYLLTFFLTSLFCAGVFSDDYLKTFIGETQRRTGVLFYLGMAIFMFGSALFANIQMVLKLYLSASFLAIILVIYGFAQFSGNDPVAWDNPYNSIILTLGNPNYASAIMSILGILLFAFAMHLNGIKRLSLITLGVALLLLIVFSNSRQGLVSFGVGVNVLILTIMFKKSLRLGVAYLAFSLVSSIFVILGMLQIGPLEKYLYKSSVSIRGYYWRAGLDMFMSKPLTGVGIDSYGDYFKEFRSVEYPLRYGFQITSDNAHNVFIQFLSTGGLFVGLSYLLLMVFIFLYGIKMLKSSQGDEIFLLSGLFGAWIAFVAQSVISIDNVGLTIWGWILGGLILGTSYSKHDLPLESNKNQTRQQLNLLLVRQRMLSSILILPMIIGVSLHFRVEKEMYKIASLGGSINATTPAPYNNALLQETLLNGSKLKILDSSHKLTIAALLRDNGNSREYDKILSDLIESDPRCLTCLKVRAEVYELNTNWESALKTYKLIANLDPWNAENYLRIANAHAVLGQKQAAINSLDKILTFAGNTEIGIRALEGKKKLLTQ